MIRRVISATLYQWVSCHEDRHAIGQDLVMHAEDRGWLVSAEMAMWMSTDH